jgi:hypothetical protein
VIPVAPIKNEIYVSYPAVFITTIRGLIEFGTSFDP